MNNWSKKKEKKKSYSELTINGMHVQNEVAKRNKS